jgi:hypothetical protein
MRPVDPALGPGGVTGAHAVHDQHVHGLLAGLRHDACDAGRRGAGAHHGRRAIRRGTAAQEAEQKAGKHAADEGMEQLDGPHGA